MHFKLFKKIFLCLIIQGFTIYLYADATKGINLAKAQLGIFSAGGFGSLNSSDLRGGYTNIFASLGLDTKSYYGFSLGIGISANVPLHKVKNNDIYSNIYDGGFGSGFLINNDEAKDFRYVSKTLVFNTLYLKYSNKWGNIQIGRFPLETQWIGDYIQGIGVDINYFDNLIIKAGWFNAQSYSNAEENVDFNYLTNLYNEYEGYNIKNNYYLDINYEYNWLNLNAYYNYFQTLLGVIGLKSNMLFGYKNFIFESLIHLALVNASKQSFDYCKNPLLSSEVGLSCYVNNSMGDVFGYLLELQQKISYNNINTTLGYIQNDSKNATNNLPIYADDSPLEYNTVIYGEGAKTIYGKFKYQYNIYYAKLKYGMSFYGYDKESFHQSQVNAITGIDLKNLNIALMYINIDDSSSYKNNIVKFWLGVKF